MSSQKERILQRLNEMGAEPKRSLGQNFLISDHVIEKILQAVQPESSASILEIGPGLGALTERLLRFQKPVKLIELDRNFAAYWRARPEAPEVHEADALQLDWRELKLPAQTVLVSNLPYQISSSLVIERSVQRFNIHRMVLMFQKEVAQRLMAKPRTKEYGLLTVMAQAFWKCENLVEAAPGAFFPAPNVASRVVVFSERDPFSLLVSRKSEEPTSSEESRSNFDSAGFLKFVKGAFSHRRKLMLKNLSDEYFHTRSVVPKLEEIFTLQKLGLQSRAEELDPAQFLRLYMAVKASV